MQKILRHITRRACGRGNTAVFATGGIDSTALVLLALPRRPRLVFAAVQSPRCQAYNDASVKACRQLAATLDLPLNVIPVNAKDYFKSFLHLGRILQAPCDDTDLPAAAILFRHCRKLGIRTVISGMGSDELFTRDARALRTFMAATALPAAGVHGMIAKSFGIRFLCPFLHKDMLAWALGTPLKERKTKEPLRAIVAQDGTPGAIMRARPAAHSIIPDDFLRPLQTWLGPDAKHRGRKELFHTAAAAAWQRHHPASPR